MEKLDEYTNLLDLTKLSLDGSFLGKKRIPDYCIENSVDVITNLAYFKYNTSKDKYFIYSIKIRTQENKPDEEIRPFLIKNLNKHSGVSNKLRDIFKEYMISGESMYATPYDPSIKEHIFQVIKKINSIELVDDLEFENYTIEDKSNVYKVILNQKLYVKNSNVSQEDMNILRTFNNIFISKTMRDLLYKKTNLGDKNVYFKKFKDNYFDYNNSSLVPIEGRKNVFFIKGIKLSTNFYENNNIFIKAVTKLRMIYTITYMEYFAYRKQSLEYYRNTFIGKKGRKIYDDEEIKISDIILDYPTNIQFDHPKFGNINLAEFMSKRWNLKIENEKQPILVRHFEKSIKRDASTSYYLPQFVYILGKLPEDDQLNVAKSLSMRPQEKFEHSYSVLKEIFNFYNNKCENIEPVRLEKVPILVKPRIQFSNKISNINDDGKIEMIEFTPYEEFNFSSWYFLYLSEINKDKAEFFYLGLKNYCKKTFNKELPIPNVLEIKHDYKNINLLKNEINESLKMIINEEEKIRKIRKKDEISFIIFFIPKKSIDIYNCFKIALNQSSLILPPSQVVVNDPKKQVDSVYRNIFNQIGAKNNKAIWRFKPIDTQIQSQTIVISYAVANDLKNNQSYLSLAVSINSDYTKYIYRAKKYESSSSYLCPVIGEKFREALKCIKQFQKPIYNIIIYREGLNESQRRQVNEGLINEILEIKKVLESVKLNEREVDEKNAFPKKVFENSQICFIFVNPNCDIKLFKIDEDREGIEHIKKNIMNSRLKVENIPIGLIIEDVIVSNDNKEFYLNSAYSSIGTNNPTRYIITLNETGLDLTFIYMLTYYLTFVYFNHPKSIKIPAPLHQNIRMNNNSIQHLSDQQNGRLPGIAL